MESGDQATIVKHQRTVIALIVLAAALIAAVFSHWAIDVLGDYLVPDDAYDHVAHGSRIDIFALALGLAALLAWRVLSAMFRAARSERARVLLIRISRRYAIGATLATVALALSLVPAMEAFDTLRAGGDVDSLADAFGGSLMLGIATTLGCALVTCAAVYTVLRWICRHRERFAACLSKLIELARPRLDIPGVLRECRGNTPRAILLRTAARSKRGPPALASANS